MNSFMKQFKAAVTGDDVEAQAAKAWRSAESSLKIQIASLEGDLTEKEEVVAEKEDALKNARINNGKAFKGAVDRKVYINNLIDRKNELTEAEDALKHHKAELAFLRAEYKALRED